MVLIMSVEGGESRTKRYLRRRFKDELGNEKWRRKPGLEGKKGRTRSREVVWKETRGG